MKRLIILLLLVGLCGCATVKVSKLPIPEKKIEIKTIYVKEFNCKYEEIAQIVKNSMISTLLGTVKIVDSSNKADVIIEGNIAYFERKSSSYTSTTHFIKSVDAVVKSKEGEILYVASFSQTEIGIAWGGEVSPTKVGVKLGEKLKEYFK